MRRTTWLNLIILLLICFSVFSFGNSSIISGKSEPLACIVDTKNNQIFTFESISELDSFMAHISSEKDYLILTSNQDFLQSLVEHFSNLEQTNVEVCDYNNNSITIGKQKLEGKIIIVNFRPQD